MKPRVSRISFEEIVLVGLLALSPVVFSRRTAEVFEVPKAAVLLTAALILLWRGLASQLETIRRLTPVAWLRTMPSRVVSMARGDPLGASVGIFLASAVASTFASPNPVQSFYGAPDSFAGLSVGVATAIVYFASRAASAGRPDSLVRFATAAGLAGAVAATYGLLQIAGLDPMAWSRTATFGREMRIFATLGHPNHLGAYLSMTIPLMIWLAARARGGLRRWAWILVAMSSVIVLAATLSRGAWIGIAAAGTAWIFLHLLSRRRSQSPPRGRHPSRSVRIAALAAVALLVFGASAVLLRHSPIGTNLLTRVRQIASLRAPTTQSRILIWQAGMRMARDHPVRGVGLDAFGIAFPRYRPLEYWKVEWGFTPTKAHNEAIQILATQGVPGAVAGLLVVLCAGYVVWRCVRRGEASVRAAAIPAGASLVAFLIQDLTSFTVAALGALAAALAGWLSAASPRLQPALAEPRVLKSGRKPWALGIAGIPVLVLFAQVVIVPIRAQIAEAVALHTRSEGAAHFQALRRAASLAPWNSTYQNSLGLSLLTQALAERNQTFRRGLLRDARAAGERAIQMEPENGYYRSNLGQIEAGQAALTPPDASTQDVRAAFAQAVARDSVNAEILDQAGQTLIQLGSVGEGRGLILRSARLYPGLAQPLAILGSLALAQNRWSDAADTLTLAIRGLWWGDDAARAVTATNLSVASLALGRNEEARRAAEMALEIEPANRDAQENLRLALARLRDGAGSARGTP